MNLIDEFCVGFKATEREAVVFCWFHQEGRAVKLPQAELD